MAEVQEGTQQPIKTDVRADDNVVFVGRKG